tara:strand:+ start:2537 stop:2896 length:360 start_codon:yes stop_codon:yes gene_type:complete
MDLTNKQMDEAMERVEADEAYALANAANNSSAYVATRYAQLYDSPGRPLPVRQGAALDGVVGPLFPVDSKQGKRTGVSSYPTSTGKGIRAVLRDDMTGELGHFLIETDGFNGVEVTAKV